MSILKNTYTGLNDDRQFDLTRSDFLFERKPNINKAKKCAIDHLKLKPKNKAYTAYLAGILSGDAYGYKRDYENEKLMHIKIRYCEKEIETLFQLMLYLIHSGLDYRVRTVLLRAEDAFNRLDSINAQNTEISL